MSKDRSEITQQLMENLAVVRRGMMHRRAHHHSHMHSSQGELLVLLFRSRKSLTIKDIAADLHISSSAVTQQVEVLEKAGFVERVRSEIDKREVVVKVKPGGRLRAMRQRKEFFGHFAGLFDVLDTDELQAFCDITGKLANHIKTPEASDTLAIHDANHPATRQPSKK